MSNIMLAPPLRLILTGECNGKCFFCHHEGCSSIHENMPEWILEECIEASKELEIERISLTGGEPTIRHDISNIICKIKRELPEVELSITTNGLKITEIDKAAIKALDNINLSIISFDESVYNKYQKVNPNKSLNYLIDYKKKTTINIVIVEENKNEIIDIVNKCLGYGYAVDLMFELISDDISIQKEVIKELVINYGMFNICYSSTPVMALCCDPNVKLRIKTPRVSKIIKRTICDGCIYYNECPEKVCSLRVYPNGVVSPCLNGYKTSNEARVKDKIVSLYSKLMVDMDSLYSTFLY